jgi:hypothetical protein
MTMTMAVAWLGHRGSGEAKRSGAGEEQSGFHHPTIIAELS